MREVDEYTLNSLVFTEMSDKEDMVITQRRCENHKGLLKP